jgi:predicted ABC-type ATPase
MKLKNKLSLIVIDGPMGSGKTTLSKLLHKKLEGTARVPLDEIKKYISGFRNDHLYKKTSQDIVKIMTEEYLKRGISVIIEWAMKGAHVEDFINIAKRNKARCFVYQLNAPPELLIKRVEERTKIFLNKSKLAKRNIENIKKHFEDHYGFHEKTKYEGAVVIDSKKLSPGQITKFILKEVKK